MKRLILLVALVMAMAVLAPAAFADDDTDEVEGADVEMDEKDPFEAQLWKTQMIALTFEVGETKVVSIRTGTDGAIGHAVGWGVLYKVMLCAGSAAFESGDFENGWAVGQLCKDYERSTETPKNFGQLQKEQKSEKSQKPTPPGQEKKLAKAGG